MNRRMRTCASACAVALLVAAGGALAADPKESAPPAMSPEMAEYMKLAQPGEHHKHLARMVGTWKAHTKFWMAPGAPPQESDGTMTVKPALDGRFFVSDVEGTMMGQPFRGMAVDGYDNVRQKHIGTWADTMGTMMMSFEGTCSDGGNVQEMRSDFVDPISHKPGYMRTVTTHKDDNTVVMEGFGPGPDGKELKMMEITYTRK